ncbi:DUF4269 domain-containing protein [Paenibacillus mendelii]|uniref:DUF4269 domain-containing protein n=1 Tax=Paenibacillus mendelii TaxID=206163 RepID=A0ABV6JFU3_9BACL|nr:DUF4269 domain-containing protein [Paenibacillus mendelii]MCQ6557659.1 DUF4269 domain-containing protein [Paenibacillus mendelii]
MDHLESRFLNIAYLSSGSVRQIEAYLALKALRIFERLEPYYPILVGTIPIGVDVAGSDLDIICEVMDMDRFEDIVTQLYRANENFNVRRRIAAGIERILVEFNYEGWPIELFGQAVRTMQQNGFKHMVIEHRILEALNEEGKARIRGLKESGLKTEPAFGSYLGIQGDPYQSLLQMYDWDDDKLLSFLHTDSKHSRV